MEHTVWSAYAAAAFGLEGLVSSELKRLGLKNVKAENGGVRFTASTEELFFCNLRLRFCDRVYILLNEQPCDTFESCFQQVRKIPWQTMMSGSESMNVTCRCVRSKLMSERDCQSVAKKAIIEKLKETTGQNRFSESGPPFPVHLSIRDDMLKIFLNTSGDALSRRGYRTWNGEAPLRETLAAALVELSPWRPGMPLYDPCCGTGTILIEAAFRESHRAPGLLRHFAMEQFVFTDSFALQSVRDQESNEYKPDLIRNISGSDLDPEALTLAKKHALQAGLETSIHFKTADLRHLVLEGDPGVLICNPPYGERLSDQYSCRQLYHELRLLKDRNPGWSLCAISSDPGFEKAYGKRANRKRRLYNGRLECNYYIYNA